MTPLAFNVLAQEARGLLARLERLKPFSLITPAVPAAMVSPAAQAAIENQVINGRTRIRTQIVGFLRWLHEISESSVAAEAGQRRLVLLRLQFNALLSQVHIFADVLTQRSEHEIGVWIAGLDDVAADALALPGHYYSVPPVICYLDRGAGGAIRRARTRLPGGDPSPVAIIRVPHERMVGSGIASSLAHEVGHQASALLDLVSSLRPLLRGMQAGSGPWQIAWQLWERWLSEILADFWGVARVGIASTLGLIEVVSLPRPFVFRANFDDPHPTPWIRVRLSCAMGQALFPNPQWERLSSTWAALYPLPGLNQGLIDLLSALEATTAALVALLANHRPPALRGRSLREVLGVETRQPARLIGLFQRWRQNPYELHAAPPSLAFAVLGQAKADGLLTPEAESRIIGRLLTYWAMRSALETSQVCAFDHRALLPGIRWAC